MKVTAPGLIRSTAVAAIAAGLLFVVIQPIHPPDTLASVTTGAWSAIHQATLLMTVLFLAGITGIYASQVEESGWLGLAGYVALSLGLLITAGFVFVEAFIEPLLTGSSPAFVESVLAMVEGTPTQVDLGPLPTLWSASGALFLGGCIVFGIATIRARVLSRAAAAVFAASAAMIRRMRRIWVPRFGAHLDRTRCAAAHGRADRPRPRMARLRALVEGANTSRLAAGSDDRAVRANHGGLAPAPQTQRQGDRHERHPTHQWKKRNPDGRMEEARARRRDRVPDDLHLLDPGRLPVWAGAH